MKKFLLFLGLIVSCVVSQAQAIVVTTPTTSLQSYGTYYSQGWDSIHTAYNANVTLPSGYFFLDVDMAIATAVSYTDTITMPLAPYQGQVVSLHSTDANFGHLFKTKPAFQKIDSGGGGVASKSSTLIWSGKIWKMVK